jgi:hypothetical protein
MGMWMREEREIREGGGNSVILEAFVMDFVAELVLSKILWFC